MAYGGGGHSSYLSNQRVSSLPSAKAALAPPKLGIFENPEHQSPKGYLAKQGSQQRLAQLQPAYINYAPN